MKVHRVTLQHFKRFEDRTFSFLDARGLPRDLVVLVGENGCGKSTVLQAIAATLGTATGRLSSPGELRWPGFDLKIAGRAWEDLPKVSVSISLHQDRPHFTNVVLHGTEVFWEPSAPNMPGPQTESIHWYTEQRSLSSLHLSDLADDTPTPVTLDLLRARMAQMHAFHGLVLAKRALRKGERDLYAELEERWGSVFHGRTFEGISIPNQPEHVLDQPQFFLLDPEGHPYELGEMSGAERAIFPLLFDFANWRIDNAVILIDELELHLHPPLQQALLRALPHLGTNNQFIITTHSDHVANLVDPGAIVRVS